MIFENGRPSGGQAGQNIDQALVEAIAERIAAKMTGQATAEPQSPESLARLAKALANKEVTTQGTFAVTSPVTVKDDAEKSRKTIEILKEIP